MTMAIIGQSTYIFVIAILSLSLLKKLSAPQHLQDSLAHYGHSFGLSRFSSPRLMSILIVSAELAVLITLILRFPYWMWFASALFSAYGLALVFTLSRHRSEFFDCGCSLFSSTHAGAEPIWWMASRPILLIAAVLIAGFTTNSPDELSLTNIFMSSLMGGFFIAAYLTLDFLTATLLSNHWNKEASHV
jgi:Ca2+/H+ antiporter